MKFEKGGFALGLVVGLLAGLALALGVALYITKAPVPFVDKLPQRSVEQDAAEAERNRSWDPNKPLATQVPRPAAPASAASAPPAVAAPAAPPAAGARDPAAILSGGGVSTPPGGEAFTYFMQVGAFTRPEDAEAQRAKLAMEGYAARISEREQAGRTVYRVRLGPYDTRTEADAVQARLQGAGVQTQLVRVQKP